MINRSLIRIKVTQILYSYVLTRPECTIAQAKKELNRCLGKSYELYHYLLKLPVELTHLQELRLDEARNKYLPTDEELNPNPKFINNRLVGALADNETLKQFASDHAVTWNDDPIFLRIMLDKVVGSDAYKDYMADPEHDGIVGDSLLWQQLFKQVILNDETMLDEIEQKSVYWTVDDLELMGQFACKSMRRIADNGPEPLIMPMFKDEEDSLFGEQLFTLTVSQMDENQEVLNGLLKDSRWDARRVVLMDRLIMCMALTEVRCFEKIPIPVTLNEYIELAKSFSTAASGQFVNGMLNSAIAELRKQGKVAKPEY